MDQPRFELYAFWRTSATYRVRVALNLKGLVAQEHQVDLMSGQQRDPAFLRVNPMAAIPALIDHEGAGPALTQSLAILEYLDETHPTPPLLPTDPRDRARVRSLALLLAADTHPMLPARVRAYLGKNTGIDDAGWKAWQTHWFTLGLQAFETRLSEPGTARFCHGDTPGLADITLASLIVVMRVFNIDIPAIPTIHRIMAECEVLDAFAEADPMKQRGAPT